MGHELPRALSRPTKIRILFARNFITETSSGHAVKLPRRKFLHLAAGAAAPPFTPHVARAQAYPTRPVRIIVGFAPGGPGDLLARLIGQRLSERLGQPFIVENRPGAASNIGTETVVNSLPDGYTLLLTSSANFINATFYRKLNFNFVRDIVPVAGIVRVPNIMEISPTVPARSVSEFIAYAKANPGKLSMASGGNGTASHVSGELFKMMTGVMCTFPIAAPHRPLPTWLEDRCKCCSTKSSLRLSTSDRELCARSQ